MFYKIQVKKIVSIVVLYFVLATSLFSQSNMNLTDSVLGFSTAYFETSTNGTGGNGDYLQLPNLDMSGSFTIETWFKSKIQVGGWNKIFDFGKSLNGIGTSDGVLLGFPTSNQIGFHVNGSDVAVTLPSNFIATNWNHYALVWNGSSVSLYINSILISSVTSGQNPIAATTCVKNYIAGSNWNDPSTQGLFRTFKIWKRNLSQAEIQSYYLFMNYRNDDSLYYYLPLDTALITSTNIINNTYINNASTSPIALNFPTKVTSQNNIGANWSLDNNAILLYGTYSGTLQANEILQYNINRSDNWQNIDTTNNNYWQTQLSTTSSLKNVQIRSLVNGVVSDRIFKTFYFEYSITNFFYDVNYIVSAFNNGGQSVFPTYNSQFGENGIIFSLSGDTNTYIKIDSLTGIITWDALTPIGNYNLKSIATNLVNKDTTDFTLKIRLLDDNESFRYSNTTYYVSFGSAGNSSSPILGNSVSNPLYSITPNNVPGVSIDPNTGIVSWAATAQAQRSIFTIYIEYDNRFTFTNLNLSVDYAKVNFGYTGGVQLYTVPANVRSIVVDVVGANGGAYVQETSFNSYQAQNAGGARVQATLAVTTGEVLRIYVGGAGNDACFCPSRDQLVGGFNGGGGTVESNYNYTGSYTSYFSPSGSGGGASDIRFGGDAFTNRIVVAGGGAGMGYDDNNKVPFAGFGGLNGTDPAYGNGTTGASQTQGGLGGNNNTSSNGSFGVGGKGAVSGGGGGGGWYGGGGGANSGGGGGSSYAIPSAQNVVYTTNYNGASFQNNNGSVSILPIFTNPPYFEYINESLTVNNYTPGFSMAPIPNQIGLRYVLNNAGPQFSINSSTGVISWNDQLPVGTYVINVKAFNISNDSGSNTFILIVVNNSSDSVLKYYNSSLQLTTGGNSTQGDYLQLPALDLSGSFTIQTWFKNNGSLGGYNRIFDFGTKSGIYGTSSGVLLGFASNTSLVYHSNGSDIIVNLPNNFNVTGWNHYALVRTENTLNLYINGVLINSASNINPINPNTCTSNFIGRSNWDADNATIGQFQNFSILKRAIDANELQLSYKLRTVINENELYYYLPLDSILPNTQNIANSTILKNKANSNIASIIPAILHSNHDSGARYLVNQNQIQIFGSITSQLKNNEVIEFSLDGGNTWLASTEINNSYWSAVPPSNFYGGVIKVRSRINNIVSSRIFKDFVVQYPPFAPIINGVSALNQAALINFDPTVNVLIRPVVTSYSIYSLDSLIRKIDTINPLYIYNLNNDSIYRFKIVAHNVVGPSPFSNISSAIQPINNGARYITSVVNGYITPSRSLLNDVDFKVTYKPLNDSYILDSIFINNYYDDDITQDSLNSYTFLGGGGGYIGSIFVKYKLKSFLISDSVNNGGKIVFIDSPRVQYDSFVRLKILADARYYIDSIWINSVFYYASLISGRELGLDSLPYIFNHVRADSSIRVWFKLGQVPSAPFLDSGFSGNRQATIYFSRPENYGGLPILYYKIYAYSNTDTIIQITTGSPYLFTGLSNDTVYRFQVSAVNSRGESPLSNLSDPITPDPMLFNINTIVVNGTITRTRSVFMGNNIQITYSPLSGFSLDSIVVDSIKIDTTGISNTYVFVNVSRAHSIAVYYSHRGFAVHASVGDHGSLNIPNDTTVDFNSRLDIIATPELGYVLDSLLINHVKVIAINSGYIIPHVTEALTIRATFKVFAITVRSSSSGGGSIIPNQDSVLLYGSSIRYYFTPNSGYVLDSLLINGVLNRDSLSSYTFNNVRGDSTIQVVFKKQQLKIIAIANFGGTIYPDDTVLVNPGDNYTFYFNVNNGYKIDSVLVNGIDTMISNLQFTFTNVQINSQIRVVFKKQNYNVFSYAGLNGSISPSGITTVSYGDSLRLLISPNQGYSVDSLLDNGVLVLDSTTSYTIRNIAENKIILALFKNYDYIIAASAGTGGRITPSGNIKVNSYANINFNFIPDDGYQIDSVWVNNVLLPHITYSFRFDTVKINQSIRVVFRKKFFSKIVKPILKLMDTLKVIGNNINRIELRSLNNKNVFYLGFLLKDMNTNMDSIYNYALPYELSDGIYKLRGISNSNDTSDIFVIRINNSFDSLGYNKFGVNNFGQLNIPDSLNNIVDVSLGTGFTCILLNDGTLQCFGENNLMQLNVPFYANDIVSIESGSSHTVALRSNGTVLSWGYNYYGQATPPENLNNVVKIASGTQHSMAMLDNGKVVIWGDTNGLSVPSFIDSVIDIAAGSRFGIAIKSNSNVLGWGFNNSGQTSIPTNLSNVISVATGYAHTIALKSDSSIISWGLNNNQQTSVPQNKYLKIAGGVDFSLGITDSKSVVAWGNLTISTAINTSDLKNVVDIFDGSFTSHEIIFNKLSIQTSAGVGGNISPSIFAKRLNNYPIIITANEGYIIDSIFVNNNLYYAFSGGTEIGKTNFTYSFLNVSGDSTIRSTFKITSVPSAPQLVTVISGNALATVYAKEPIDFGGLPILFYKIYTYSKSRNRIDTVYSIPAIISGLINDTNYTFQISAVNARGESLLSAISDTVTPDSNLFNILASANNGIIADVKDNLNGSSFLVKHIRLGDTIRLSYVGNPGYQLDSVVVDSVKVNNLLYSKNFSFENISRNHIIAVYYSKKQYTITVNIGNNGTLNLKNDTTVDYNSNLVLLANPNVGYEVDSFIVNGNNVLLTNNSYLLAAIDTNTNIMVKFKVQTFNIITSTNFGGTIRIVGGSNLASYGSNVLIMMKAFDTFFIENINVNGNAIYQFGNGTEIGKDSVAYLFNNVRGDSSISVIYRKVQASSPPILVSASAGNSQAVINFLPPIDLNGSAIHHYIVRATSGTIEVTGTSSPIIIKNLTNGVVYRFNLVAVNDFGFESEVSALTEVLIPQDGLININTSVLNGNISLSSAVPLNSSFRVTYSPNFGYELSKIIINNVIQPLDSINGYTFKNVINDSTIRVEYKLKTFKIVALPTQNGLISPSDTSIVNYGKSLLFTMTPDEHFSLDSLFIDGFAVAPNLQFLFTNVNANHTIFAKFKSSTFIITAGAGENGIITPSGKVPVGSCNCQNFSFIPNNGFVIDSVLINGVLKSVDNNGYTFYNVKGDSSIWVNFKPISIPVNTISISVINPNCYGISGSAVVNFMSTTVYNKILLRNTLSNNTQSFIINSRNYFINNLNADSIYEITVIDSTLNSGYANRIFNIILRQPSKLSAFSEVVSNKKQVILNLSGSASYLINLNGNTFETQSNTIELPLAVGVNKIVVKPENACQGVYEETILVSENISLYPNPTTNKVTLNIGGTDTKLKLSLVTEQGKNLFTKEVELDHFRNVVLDVSNYPSGVYLIKVDGTNLDSILKFVKQ
ncbi:MAG: glycine-rich protein [Alphaproteobacteria bacterium]|nr:glycine-rich protein [Alphaproteobacteria bacterium]